MKDPERLLRSPSTELAQLLLEAGAEEKPSLNARTRMAGLVAAAAGGGALATSGTAAATAPLSELAAPNAASSLAGGATAGAAGSAGPGGAKLGWIVLVKWFGMGAIGGAVALPVVHALVPAERAARERDVTPAGLPAPARAPTPAPGERNAALAASARASAPARENAGGASPLQKVGASAAAGTEPLVPVDHVLLAAEVRFVEQGRAAFQRGAFREALALLGPYEERFPKQQLLTEVLFLRMEAFSRSGDVGRARSLAALVLSREIAGAQAVRAREVLGR